MSASPEDQGIIAELAPEAGDWMITKWRYSAFFNNDFLGRIRAAGRDQILVCGVYAQLGILITAVESYSHDVETFLVADAVADFREDRHRHALDYAAGSCAVVVTVEEAVRWLTL
jgi:trans-2,3-dihydro-3-hydroxyanthranilic acid synthase